MNSHIKTIQDGAIWHVDDLATGAVVRSQNVKIEIYEHWAKVGSSQVAWIPREQVEQIHEY